MCHNHYKENFNGWYSQPVRWYRISGRVVQLNRAVCHERPLFTALAASDSVIVPVQAQYLPAKGMTQLMKTIGKVQRQINPALKVDGVLLTLADMRTNLARVTAESIRQNYGRMVKVYQTVIPVGVKAAETSAAGQSIYRYDKNGTVAKAYASFTKEVIRDGERQRNKIAPSRSR